MTLALLSLSVRLLVFPSPAVLSSPLLSSQLLLALILLLPVEPAGHFQLGHMTAEFRPQGSWHGQRANDVVGGYLSGTDSPIPPTHPSLLENNTGPPPFFLSLLKCAARQRSIPHAKTPTDPVPEPSTAS